MKKIRIVHIAQSEGAGVTEYIKMLISKMDSTQYKIVLIGSKYYEYERDYFEARQCRVITLDMRREINLKSDIKAILELRKKLKDLKPDIIHIHSSKAGVIGRIASIGIGAKVIYNAHGWAFNMKSNFQKIFVYKIAEFSLAAFTDKIVNISEDEYKSAQLIGLSPKKMIVIKNAIDISVNKVCYNKLDILKELDIPLDAYIIGICGRITEQKSPEVFIEVCNQIIDKIPNCYFLMIGDGELKEEVIKSATDRHILGQLRITGWIAIPERYISILDVALLTSKWEGFGLVLLQYMIQQKPVIAAQVGGIPEIVKNNETGILVGWNDIEAYVMSILEVKENDELRKNIIANAYQMVITRFNIDGLVQKHEVLYKELLRINN